LEDLKAELFVEPAAGFYHASAVHSTNLLILLDLVFCTHPHFCELNTRQDRVRNVRRGTLLIFLSKTTPAD
jgi:hypothetical protein